MDLTSFASVRQGACIFVKKSSKLDVLIGNAGVMAMPKLATIIDGFETQFATNHLSHFLLFALLRDTPLSSSTPSSLAAVVAVVVFGLMTTTSRSDQKNTTLGVRTPKARRRISIWPIKSNVATDLLVYAAEYASREIVQNYIKSLEQGAATTVFAAISKEFENEGGMYLENCQVVGLHPIEGGFGEVPDVPGPAKHASTRRKHANYGNQAGKEGSTAAETESVVRRARQTFGETLPKGYLSTEEYALYERLYGPPTRETQPDDLEYLPEVEEEVYDEKARNVLLRQNVDGEYEEIEFDPELGYTVAEEDAEVALDGGERQVEDIESTGLKSEEADLQIVDEVAVDEVEIDEVVMRLQTQDRRENEVFARLRRDMEAAKIQQDIEAAVAPQLLEEIEEEYQEDDRYDEEDEQDAYMSSDAIRTHPHTMTGRSGTSPSTLYLPKDTLVNPIEELLERTDIKHLTEAAEKAFGGKGLPYSPSTLMTRERLPQRHVGLDASQHRMSEIDADAYIGAVIPGTYATVMSTLVEVRKRLGLNWIRDLIFREGGGPRVLDAGGGGAGAIAWRDILQTEWDILKDEGIIEGDSPTGKTTVLTGSDELRHRISRFLDNTTFLPRLPDYVHSANPEKLIDGAPAQGRKSYDIIIAPHTLFPLKEDFRRKHMVQNLWSLLEPNGGVLILIEKGVPRGFEAIAGARSLLLNTYISSPGGSSIETETQSPEAARVTEKEEGMIIAPCTNHTKCPMYLVPGLSSGRKDFCHFKQRYIRPKFLQRIHGATDRNHEDIQYSYIAVRRGVDARKDEIPLLQGDAATEQALAGYEDLDLPEDSEASSSETVNINFNPLSLPRAILPPIKRRGHVTLDLCTPSGKIERWTVPKSFSRTAYRDARKSTWGDLWALGAKTRVERRIRLGELVEGKRSKKNKKEGKMKEKKKGRSNQFDVIMGENGMEGIEEDRTRRKYLKVEKRTKGGRIFKERKPIGEDDL
ncbi:hypothetical protein B7494_g3096 [Chlorociboria aeruginascens]|nr:hypothetical protein B7494_g3096 [Chlorociboria aeruginascens]